MLRPTLWFNRPAHRKQAPLVLRHATASPAVAKAYTSSASWAAYSMALATLCTPSSARRCLRARGRERHTYWAAEQLRRGPDAPNQGLKLGDRVRTRGGSTGVRGSAAPSCSEPMPRRAAPSADDCDALSLPAAHDRPSRRAACKVLCWIEARSSMHGQNVRGRQGVPQRCRLRLEPQYLDRRVRYGLLSSSASAPLRPAYDSITDGSPLTLPSIAQAAVNRCSRLGGLTAV